MRIQVLPLPSVVNGDDVEEPFALVFDQAEEGLPKELLGEFARQCGAKTYVFVPQAVEVVDRYADIQPSPPVYLSEPRIQVADPADVRAMGERFAFAVDQSMGAERNRADLPSWETSFACSCGAGMSAGAVIAGDGDSRTIRVECQACGNAVNVTYRVKLGEVAVA